MHHAASGARLPRTPRDTYSDKDALLGASLRTRHIKGLPPSVRNAATVLELGAKAHYGRSINNDLHSWHNKGPVLWQAPQLLEPQEFQSLAAERG